jgi:phosphoglycolate phosphatase-like HAD superfamily hydrolase
MIIVFDVDGTLIGGEEQDWPSFDQAIQSILGFGPDKDFWASIPEVTARAIVQQACEQVGTEWSMDWEQKVCSAYLANLRKAAPHKRTVFLPKPGAQEVLGMLKLTGIFGVAIATGDFESTIKFKLGSAGIDIKGIPFACSSDRTARHDIIELAVERAGYAVDEAVYIGDGVWDLKACERLDIPFIGTGRRVDMLKDLGATVVNDLSPATLLPVIKELV